MDEKTNAMTNKEKAELQTTSGVNYGFEETKAEDILIPRIKVINALSPERVDGIADEGAVLNSLTQEDVAGQRFIPIKQYYSHIRWNPDRGAEQHMFCRSLDGRIGDGDNGVLSCESCGMTKFDNTKTGKEAQPKCTAYINFLGFFSGNPMPVVLSFARTNYNEGKKLLSIARSMRCSIWNYAYTLSSKQLSKDRNKWYIMTTTMAGATTEDERMLAFELYKAYEKVVINADYEDTAAYSDADSTTDAKTEAEI